MSLEKGNLMSDWSKDKVRRYMDWIEHKWINKYRGWVLNCLITKRRDDRREVYSILRDSNILNLYSVEELLQLWVRLSKLSKKAIYQYTKYR